MDPLAAAEALGVSPDASPAQVQRAFRQMARTEHPDIKPASTADIDLLAKARDVLLDPAHDNASRPRPTGRVSAQRVAPTRASDRRGTFGYVWAAIVAAGLVAFVAALAIGFVAIARSSSGSDAAIDAATECVLIGPSGALAVPCTETDAQQVIGEYSGARQCESGVNTLVVGATTWCLRPVE